jgi:hypothetical protein
MELPQRTWTIIVTISVVLVLAVGGLKGYEWYQWNTPCTGAQIVAREWPVFDAATQELMVTRGNTFVPSGTHDPLLMVGTTARLREDLADAVAPTVRCAEPRLMLCPFGAEGCSNYRTQFTPMVSKYYVVAYYSQDMQGWVPDPMLGVIEQFAAHFATRSEMSLQYALVAPASLTEQAATALHPQGYFASLKQTEDDINWTSNSGATVPSVLQYDRYANTANVVDIANGTDVIVVDPQLSFDDKRRWITQLQAAGYTMYIYPAAELYVQDK